MKEKLTSSPAVITITVVLMALLTISTCHVRDRDVFLFAKNRNYRNIKIHHYNYFYASVEADSGSYHINSGVVNAYAELFLINKKVQ